MKKTAIIIGCIIFLFLLLVGIPIMINEAYKMDGYVTDWSATDVLLYWGSVIGGLATLVSILIVMWHDDKKREDDIQRNDKQRAEDREFYKEEREYERQHYKKQREEDRKMSLKKERYGIIFKHLHDSLCNLDMRAFLVINECADEHSKKSTEGTARIYNQRAKKVRDIIAPDTIPNLIGNANRNVLLGLVLFSDERPYFNHVIEDLKELTKNYTSLLPILEEHKDDELRLTMDNTIDYWLDRFLEKNKDLCHKYKEIFTSVEKAMTEYEHS